MRIEFRWAAGNADRYRGYRQTRAKKAVGTDTDVANATDLVLQEVLFTGDSTGFQLEPDQ